jgi:hypothetical protein
MIYGYEYLLYDVSGVNLFSYQLNGNPVSKKDSKKHFLHINLISSEEDGCRFILMYAVYIQFLDLIDFCCQNNYGAALML